MEKNTMKSEKRDISAYNSELPYLGNKKTLIKLLQKKHTSNN